MSRLSDEGALILVLTAAQSVPLGFGARSIRLASVDGNETRSRSNMRAAGGNFFGWRGMIRTHRSVCAHVHGEFFLLGKNVAASFLPIGPRRDRVRRTTRLGWIFAAWLGVANIALAQDEGDVEIGRKAFAAQKCSICHAVAGQGNSRGPLDDVGSRLSADEIRQWLVNAPEMAEKTKATRKPAMRVFGTLPKAELDGLVAYLSSLKK